MKVLSLFDGISCGQLALKKAGIKIQKYYASEIDPHAIKITQKNFPKTQQLGDVQKIKKLPEKIDLLIGGSPCQGFSLAGRQLNFDDPRSKLFFDFVKILKKEKPKYFLLENVKMRGDIKDKISEMLGVQPIEINSKDYSGQSRTRLYWTNIPVSKLRKKDVKLSDILEEGFVDRDKSHCIDASYFKGGNLKSYFQKHRRQLVFKGKISKKKEKGSKLIFTQGDDSFYMKNPLKKPKYKYSNEIYRKLSPLETERLQTLPDNYTQVEGVSNTQRYKAIGNGWTVDVLAQIFKGLKKK